MPPPVAARWRLVASYVVPVDPPGTVWAPGVVDVAGERIAYAGPPEGAPAFDGPVRQLPGIVLPGLVNSHGHSPMTLLRGVGDGLPLERWLAEAIWPREARLTPDDVYWGMTLGAAELLRNGVTSTCETYFHDRALLDAAVDAGLRCVVTPGILDLPARGARWRWQAMLEAALGLVEEQQGRAGLVQVGLGPHAPYSLPDEALVAVGRAACEGDLLLSIHLAETRREVEALRAERGCSPVAYLAGLGVLDAPVLAAHGVWLEGAELSTLAERGVAVAHCPQSNAKLGSGCAPLVALLRAGVTVGLGTDGPASNDDLDLFEELRLAGLLARALAADPSVVETPALLTLATFGGARALRLPAGRLAGGQLADLVHLEAEDPRLVPILRPEEVPARLVWSAASHLVRDVWVGGRQVVRDGEVLGVDLGRARREVQARAERLRG
ncbi:amidohydrolase family protein [Aciditerrimonas ferrireducens]|uniref:amidohydrolase family protein n=1 Tax=Aciditerrimonas ferrireducens TaxID=667306 RepID=UPI002004E6B5|nr:amidohydrolase [Aciditerrimonas ferrireducens]MCK4177470.1 amidohydrolase [Aciditerrimonas ferrireducens]